MTRVITVFPCRYSFLVGFACIASAFGAWLGGLEASPMLKLMSGLLSMAVHVCAILVQQARVGNAMRSDGHFPEVRRAAISYASPHTHTATLAQPIRDPIRMHPYTSVHTPHRLALPVPNSILVYRPSECRPVIPSLSRPSPSVPKTTGYPIATPPCALTVVAPHLHPHPSLALCPQSDPPNLQLARRNSSLLCAAPPLPFPCPTYHSRSLPHPTLNLSPSLAPPLCPSALS